MIVSLLPTVAFAESAADTPVHDGIKFDKEIKTFADLENLFANGGNGYLANDIVVTDYLYARAKVNLLP